MTVYDGARLRASLAAVPASLWSLPSSYAETGVHHRYRQLPLCRGGVRLPEASSFAHVLDDFKPVHAAFLSLTEPGGFIAPHVDAGPYWERWHVPIIAAGEWQEGGRVVIPRAGVPFRVRHFHPHAVWNDTDVARVHLVIDVDRPLMWPTGTFRLFAIPEDRRALVAAATVTPNRI